MPRYFLVLLVVAVSIIILSVYRTELSLIQSTTIGEFGGVSLRIEYATTSESRERGLGGRESIAPDYGMLFVFPNNGYYGFWMKDTLVPLDIFWLDASAGGESASGGQEQLIVVSFKTDVLPSTYPNVFYPSVPARYVLETAAGFARAHDITIGMPLLLKNFPSVSE